MGRHNVVSGIIVFAVVLIIAVSAFLVVNYTSGVLSAAVSYASSDQIDKLQACGISPPAELYKLQYDLPNLLLPAVYVGFPGLMVLISMLMFIAGYYYGGDDGSGHSSSETTTTTSSPGWNKMSGKYDAGKRTERTTTRKSSKGKGRDSE